MLKNKTIYWSPEYLRYYKCGFNYYQSEFDHEKS